MPEVNENADIENIPLTELEKGSTEATQPEEKEPEAAEDDDVPDDTNEEGDGLDAESEDEPVEAPKTRGEQRHQKLANEAKAERERADKIALQNSQYETELKFIRQQQQNLQIENQRKVDAERLANMEPHERMAYENQMQGQYFQNELARIRFEMQDSKDKAVFEAKSTIDDNYRRHSDAVEKKHAEFAAQGLHYQREDILRHMLGDELLNNRNSLQEKKKAAAAKRVSAVSSDPQRVRSDASTAKRGKTAEERLEGLQI